MKALRYLLLFLLFIAYRNTNAQSNDPSLLDLTIANFQHQSITHPIEKAYLQLDRSLYGAGDTIWFKAYVVTGSMHELSGISNVLNVELVNDRDSVKRSIKLFMENGLCHGDLALPDSIKEGNYRIRAYTNCMRNAGEEYYFDQNIRIINAIIAKAPLEITSSHIAAAKQPITTSPKVDVQFFPEGGSLVSGIDCKVGFKAVNANGSGIVVNGIITDEQDNKVAEFSSGPLGMGFFTLNTETGKIYKARISAVNGHESIVQLPTAIVNGYALSVCEAGPDNIRAIVMAGKEAITNGQMSLIAQAGGTIYYVGKSKPGSSSFVTTIAKNKFPTGIVQFTLFSSNGEPVNERLMFIQNNDQLKLDIASEQQIYAPQQKVKLQLTATNANNTKPAQGSFSIAVTDESKVPAGETAESTILSNLLLTSDLKGYVENPGYYFASINDHTQADLDALMLTQGYRKFIWQKTVSDNEISAVYPIDTGLTISGHLTRKGNKPIANGKVTLYTMEGGFFSRDTLTDNTGRFAFRNMAFADKTSFVVQSDEKNRTDYRISVDKDNVKAMPNKNAPELMINDQTDLQQFIDNNKKLYDKEIQYDYNGKAKLLKEVIIKEKSQQSLASPNSILKSGRHADYVITAKQLATFPSVRLSDHLFGLIPGVKRDKDGELRIGSKAVWTIVDGFRVDGIDQINLRSIETIEVLLSNIYPVVNLIVTTKRGITDDDMVYTESLSGYKKFTPIGFHKVREFYSPQYDNPKTNIPIANLRSTIYWQPDVKTDKEGKATIEYFNAGTKGNYKVVVEGIDDSGKLSCQVYRYKVN